MKNFASQKKIAFLYKAGRKKRLLNKNLKFPSEFFYGYIELLEQGHKVEIFEENDLGFRLRNKYLDLVLIFISKILFNIPINMFFGFIFSGSYRKLYRFKTIIATTNALGICLALSKKLGFLENEVIFINMGLFAKRQSIFKTFIYKRILENVKMLSLSKYESKFLSYEFKSNNVNYLQFGVDKNFWKKNESFQDNSPKKNQYILSIGGDLARDWNLLTDSWQSDFPCLKIVSPRKINSSKNNIQVISSSWHDDKLSDLEIKDIISKSLFVIIPLKETIQPSGQSSCLQAMSCGKAVIISDIQGIWDRDLLLHEENIFLVKPSDGKSLIEGIKVLLRENSLRTKIEKNGRKLIQEEFNSYKMADNLKEYLED